VSQHQTRGPSKIGQVRRRKDLAALGGKGAFVKTIDRALLLGEIDAAIHCMKDVPGDVPLPPGLVFASYLPREDIRDCLVFPLSSPRITLADLPAGARIGSSSVRRKAQLGRHRPDLAVHRIRGNVNSRLLRLDAGDFDALVLARAGLGWDASGTPSGRRRRLTPTPCARRSARASSASSAGPTTGTSSNSSIS
jgi:hydroxymethylbilane synthase